MTKSRRPLQKPPVYRGPRNPFSRVERLRWKADQAGQRAAALKRRGLAGSAQTARARERAVAAQLRAAITARDARRQARRDRRGAALQSLWEQTRSDFDRLSALLGGDGNDGPGRGPDFDMPPAAQPYTPPDRQETTTTGDDDMGVPVVTGVLDLWDHFLKLILSWGEFNPSQRPDSPYNISKRVERDLDKRQPDETAKCTRCDQPINRHGSTWFHSRAANLAALCPAAVAPKPVTPPDETPPPPPTDMTRRRRRQQRRPDDEDTRAPEPEPQNLDFDVPPAPPASTSNVRVGGGELRVEADDDWCICGHLASQCGHVAASTPAELDIGPLSPPPPVAD